MWQVIFISLLLFAAQYKYLMIVITYFGSMHLTVSKWISPNFRSASYRSVKLKANVAHKYNCYSMLRPFRLKRVAFSTFWVHSQTPNCLNYYRRNGRFTAKRILVSLFEKKKPTHLNHNTIFHLSYGNAYGIRSHCKENVRNRSNNHSMKYIFKSN